MKALRTNFPYELNENRKGLIQGAPIGANFCPIERSSERDNRCHKKQNSQHSEV